MQGWKIITFANAAHANLDDGVSSFGEHIGFLVDAAGQCCPLNWQAKKIKRVVRSAIAAECLSLQEGLEDYYFLRTLIEDLLGLKVGSTPITAYVDNKSVVDAVYSTKMVDDKRLCLDIAAVWESLKQ